MFFKPLPKSERVSPPYLPRFGALQGTSLGRASRNVSNNAEKCNRAHGSSREAKKVHFSRDIMKNGLSERSGPLKQPHGSISSYFTHLGTPGGAPGPVLPKPRFFTHFEGRTPPFFLLCFHAKSFAPKSGAWNDICFFE